MSIAVDGEEMAGGSTTAGEKMQLESAVEDKQKQIKLAADAYASTFQAKEAEVAKLAKQRGELESAVQAKGSEAYWYWYDCVLTNKS